MLTYKDYTSTISFSAEDEVFYGKLIGINDLVTFEGRSVQELKKSFHDAVDDYLETCHQLKKEPEKQYKGSFNVRVPAELHRLAALTAAKKKLTLNQFIKSALSYAIVHEGELKCRG
jgi:predicted HicB family RNase H-like nuclease